MTPATAVVAKVEETKLVLENVVLSQQSTTSITSQMITPYSFGVMTMPQGMNGSDILGLTNNNTISILCGGTGSGNGGGNSDFQIAVHRTISGINTIGTMGAVCSDYIDPNPIKDEAELLDGLNKGSINCGLITHSNLEYAGTIRLGDAGFNFNGNGGFFRVFRVFGVQIDKDGIFSSDNNCPIIINSGGTIIINNGGTFSIDGVCSLQPIKEKAVRIYTTKIGSCGIIRTGNAGGQFVDCSGGGEGFTDPTSNSDRNLYLKDLSDLFQELGATLHPKYVTFAPTMYSSHLFQIISFLKNSKNILIAGLYNIGNIEEDTLKFCKALTNVIEENQTLKQLRIYGKPLGSLCINLLAESLVKKPNFKLMLHDVNEDTLLKKAIELIEDRTNLTEKNVLVLQVMSKDVAELTFQYAGWSKEKESSVGPMKKPKVRV